MPDSLRDRIVDAASDKFLRDGFSSVTTDEIAADLGISKKTLYQHFDSKKNLLESVIDRFTHEVELQVKGITLDNSLEFTAKIELMLMLIARRLSRIRQPLIKDIRRSAPELWDRIQKFRKKHIISRFEELISEGIVNGEIRDDLDPTLLMLILTRLFDSVLTPEVLADIPYSTNEVFSAVMDTFFAGILSPKGIEKYKTKHQSEKPNSGVK